MEIVLIRHGQPDWLHGEDYTLDPRLTDLGKKQAEQSSKSLQKVGFEELWVSDLKRAQETLIPFEKNLDFNSTHVFGWLREMQDEKEKALFGKSKEEIEEFFLNRNSRPLDEWLNNYHGEYIVKFRDKIVQNLEKELSSRGVGVVEKKIEKVFSIENSGNRRILIISHAGTMSVLLSYFLDIPLFPWTWRRFLPVHCAHTSLRSTKIEGGYIFRMKKFNDSSFYNKKEFLTY